ncbi:MAG TPA: helix-turn-helix transcriptional regulator [Oculatellaceae cyanobacterium]
MTNIDPNALGSYLKDRRAKLDPTAFGLPATRRRTPGLRREEVAQRASVSATWYTWLEQGRGGAPSPKVLDRIAQALMLTDAEREHVYLLALGRLPEVAFKEQEGISPRLQSVLDGFELCPAFVRSSTWDIIGWNCAAAAVLTDYGALEKAQRNVLRLMFLYPKWQSQFDEWKEVARAVVALFRADVVRTGATDAVKALVDELSALSPVFKEMWSNNDVAMPGEATKLLHHPLVGAITMELSSFTVDGRPDLRMVVYCPATEADANRIRELVKTHRNVREKQLTSA